MNSEKEKEIQMQHMPIFEYLFSFQSNLPKISLYMKQ